MVPSPCTAGAGYQGNVPSRGCTALLFSSAGLWVASAGQPAAHGLAMSPCKNSMRARVGLPRTGLASGTVIWGMLVLTTYFFLNKLFSEELQLL